MIDIQRKIKYTCYMGNQRAKAAYPSFTEDSPSGRKKGGMVMYITYSDLFQLLIFITALIGLCYQIFKGKK